MLPIPMWFFFQVVHMSNVKSNSYETFKIKLIGIIYEIGRKGNESLCLYVKSDFHEMESKFHFQWSIICIVSIYKNSVSNDLFKGQ